MPEVLIIFHFPNISFFLFGNQYIKYLYPPSFMSHQKVLLRVYNLASPQTLFFCKTLGLNFKGIWHSSIVVYDKEYFYSSGIRNTQPGFSGYGMHVYEHDMGETLIQHEIFIEYLESINGDYNVDTYHVLKNNCNHFIDDVIKFLLDKTIPEYIHECLKIIEESPHREIIENIIKNVRF
ncbi:PPPDE putative peptidase domain containing protein [Spraguea lophii 42_110]|uniref:PPPDE putative peptidase domain containing protein n=1 Tax=Spraguea lophii (strain 42_110) TaxID=1358809 RepID=S7XKG4_SPRLO|nr:PPPDE putative peptidase domain containing protein [Spraguea lophii 42_110]